MLTFSIKDTGPSSTSQFINTLICIFECIIIRPLSNLVTNYDLMGYIKISTNLIKGYVLIVISVSYIWAMFVSRNIIPRSQTVNLLLLN